MFSVKISSKYNVLIIVINEKIIKYHQELLSLIYTLKVLLRIVFRKQKFNI